MTFVALALAHHRLGQTDEARAALAHARAILANKMPDPARGQPLGEDWAHWLLCQVLAREAEDRLKNNAKGD